MSAEADICLYSAFVMSEFLGPGGALSIASRLQKEKAAFPGGKTAYLARSRMVQPRHVMRTEGKGRSVLAVATLGP